jgi:ribokinase
MVGRVGDDAFGCELRESLEREGVDASAVLMTEGCSTGVASIVVVEGDNGILIAPGANACFLRGRQSRARCSKRLVRALSARNPRGDRSRGVAAREAGGGWTILNPARSTLPDEAFSLVDFFFPNSIELEQFSGIPVLRTEPRAQRGAVRIVVTPEEGCVDVRRFRAGSREGSRRGRRRQHRSRDAFVAAFAVALAEGRTPRDAVELAVCAGALACTRFGAREGLPRRADVDVLAAAMRRESPFS